MARRCYAYCASRRIRQPLRPFVELRHACRVILCYATRLPPSRRYATAPFADGQLRRHARLPSVFQPQHYATPNTDNAAASAGHFMPIRAAATAIAPPPRFSTTVTIPRRCRQFLLSPMDCQRGKSGERDIDVTTPPPNDAFTANITESSRYRNAAFTDTEYSLHILIPRLPSQAQNTSMLHNSHIIAFHITATLLSHCHFMPDANTDYYIDAARLFSHDSFRGRYAIDSATRLIEQAEISRQRRDF